MLFEKTSGMLLTCNLPIMKNPLSEDNVLVLVLACGKEINSSTKKMLAIFEDEILKIKENGITIQEKFRNFKVHLCPIFCLCSDLKSLYQYFEKSIRYHCVFCDIDYHVDFLNPNFLLWEQSIEQIKATLKENITNLKSKSQNLIKDLRKEIRFLKRKTISINDRKTRKKSVNVFKKDEEKAKNLKRNRKNSTRIKEKYPRFSNKFWKAISRKKRKQTQKTDSIESTKNQF